MFDPVTELAWKQVVGNPKNIRSLFDPTEIVSLYLTQGKDVVKVVDEFVPLKDFHLHSFFAHLDPERPFRFCLDLRSKTAALGESISACFEVRWRSFYIADSSSALFKFTFRPASIFVLIPSIVTRNVSDFIVARKTRHVKAIELPAIPSPVLRQLREKYLSNAAAARLRGSPPRRNKKGFSGLPASKPSTSESIQVYDAVFVRDFAPVFSGHRSIQTFSKSVTSVRTPNFRNLQKALLPVNPYRAEIIRTADNPGLATFIGPLPDFNTRNYYGSSQYTFFTPPSVLAFSANTYNRALSKAEDVAEISIEANIAQDIAQFGQLKTLVASTTRNLAKAYKCVKAKNFDGALAALANEKRGPRARTYREWGLNASKTAAENWLQLQYAWKPLLHDVDGLMRLFAQTIVQRPPLRTVRAVSNPDESNYLINQGPFLTGAPPVKMEIKEKQTVKVVIRYTVRSELTTYVQQLGFTNPVNLAWEVLPYSFVVDWFIPIGPYLSSVSAWQGLTFKDGSVTRFARQEVNAAFDQSVTSGANTQRKAGSFQRTWIKIQRDKLTAFPRKDLPSFKDPRSLEHALNGIALLRTAFRK